MRNATTRQSPDGPAFSPLTGQGYVAAAGAPYDRARRHGATVAPLLFETLGGWGTETVALLRRATEARGNKLRGSEYDDTSWSARTWMGFTAQRVACALARAVAWELAPRHGHNLLRRTSDESGYACERKAALSALSHAEETGAQHG